MSKSEFTSNNGEEWCKTYRVPGRFGETPTLSDS